MSRFTVHLGHRCPGCPPLSRLSCPGCPGCPAPRHMTRSRALRHAAAHRNGSLSRLSHARTSDNRTGALISTGAATMPRHAAVPINSSGKRPRRSNPDRTRSASLPGVSRCRLPLCQTHAAIPRTATRRQRTHRRSAGEARDTRYLWSVAMLLGWPCHPPFCPGGMCRSCPGVEKTQEAAVCCCVWRRWRYLGVALP